MEERIVRVGSVSLATRAWSRGDGPCVVLVHGLGHNVESWGALIPRLRDWCTVIAFDRRGHGHSSDATGYNATDLAGDLAAVIDAYSVVDPILIGHSIGGWDCLTYATRRSAAAVICLDQAIASEDPEPLALLPDDITGQCILDLACGAGRISRWLAERGAQITGVDLSAGLLGHARQLESAQPLGIDYVQGSATDTNWWDRVPYDGVLCHMALMDIDDIDAAFDTVAAVLAPGGWFTFSILHPCFPGAEDELWSGLSSWPPEHGYTREGWWNTNGDGIRGQVGSNHRMLATYLNGMLDAGLVPDQFAERGTSLPAILLVRCRGTN